VTALCFMDRLTRRNPIHGQRIVRVGKIRPCLLGAWTLAPVGAVPGRVHDPIQFDRQAIEGWILELRETCACTRFRSGPERACPCAAR
jgi:hypothetical protein